MTFSSLFLSNALVIASLWLIFWLETFCHNSSTAIEQPEKEQHCELSYAKILSYLLISSAFRRKSEDVPLLPLFFCNVKKKKKENKKRARELQKSLWTQSRTLTFKTKIFLFALMIALQK